MEKGKRVAIPPGWQPGEEVIIDDVQGRKKYVKEVKINEALKTLNKNSDGKKNTDKEHVEKITGGKEAAMKSGGPLVHYWFNKIPA